MPIICAVIGCTNRHATIRIPKVVTNQGPEAHELSERRRREWIRQIGRKDITFTSATYQRICKIHFVTDATDSILVWRSSSSVFGRYHYQVPLSGNPREIVCVPDQKSVGPKFSVSLVPGTSLLSGCLTTESGPLGEDAGTLRDITNGDFISLMLSAENVEKCGDVTLPDGSCLSRYFEVLYFWLMKFTTHAFNSRSQTSVQAKCGRVRKDYFKLVARSHYSIPCTLCAAAAQWNQHHPDWIPTLHMGHDVLWKSDSGRKKSAVGKRRADVQGAACSSEEETHAKEQAPASQTSSIKMSPASTRSRAQKRKVISTGINRGRKKVIRQDQSDEGVINVGREFARWCQLAEELGVISNEAVAGILLDLYYAQRSPAYSDAGEAVSNPLARPVALYKVAARSSPRSSIEDMATEAADCNGTAEQKDVTTVAEVKIETDVAQDPLFTGNHTTQHLQLYRPVKKELATESTASSLQTEEMSPTTQAVSSTYLDVRVKLEAADYE